eukprot:175842_1
MACACPCFGDEADAEEKPNQMIQLDGLGMLRLDTQHVGQGSQGARSAKWFYFGETDNRLAVVNMLLCITCLLLWILVICAVLGLFNTSGTENTLLNIKKNVNGQQHDTEHKATDVSATDRSVEFKNLKTQFDQYRAKYPEDITKHTMYKKLADKLQTVQKKFDASTAKLNELTAAIDKIQDDDGSEKIELKKLPEYVRSIHKSKVDTEKKLQNMKADIDKIQSAFGSEKIELKKLPEYVRSIHKSKVDAEKKLQKMKALFQELTDDNDENPLEERPTTQPILDGSDNDDEEERKSKNNNDVPEPGVVQHASQNDS